MPYRTICISRDVGAAGEEIGHLVAESLGFRYVDEDIVRAAADSAGVDAETVTTTEQRRTLAHKLLDLVAQSGAPEAYAFAPEIGDLSQLSGSSEAVREVIREAVRETAETGGAVIVAHAASHVLAGRPDVLRILVTGSPDVRAKRLAERTDAADATDTVREAEKARADYLRRFHQVKQELPTHYDLVVNTDALSVDAAAAVITGAATR